jgi:hypothetical protein
VIGRYVYCISELPCELGSLGLYAKPVRCLEYSGVVAFVSDVSSDKITPDVETISGHQRVVEASRKVSTTLPVKFGVMFQNDAGVKKMLATNLEQYKTKLASFRGKDEFGVKVIESGSSKPAGKKTGAKKGTEYLMELKRDEAARMERLRAREKVKERVDLELAGTVDASASLRTDLPQILVNAAYLVSQSRQESFSRKVEALRERLGGEGFLVHVSGPWAPYSFC